MEIKEYFQILRRNWILIVATIIVFCLVAFFVTEKQPYNYQSSSAIEIIRYQSQSQADVPYFQYNNYYANQAAAAVSDNIIGWLSSASTVAEIYQRAGYPLPAASIRALSKTFTIQKKIGTSAVIDVSYSSKNQEQAITLIKTASEVVKERVEQQNKSDTSSILSVRVNEPVSIAEPKPTGLNTSIAGFAGLLVALGIVSIREALKK
jgi:capsular polysaccharide biosynthesis protein